MILMNLAMAITILHGLRAAHELALLSESEIDAMMILRTEINRAISDKIAETFANKPATATWPEC